MFKLFICCCLFVDIRVEVEVDIGFLFVMELEIIFNFNYLFYNFFKICFYNINIFWDVNGILFCVR